MKTLVVYFSRFGNTRKVAEAIAARLRSAGTVQLIGAEELPATDLDGVDLVVMGTPTHNMNLPAAVKPLFDSLARGRFKGKPVAAFDTSYKLSWWLRPFTAAKRLSRKLRRFGGRQIVPPETFLVVEREGPLYEGELQRAALWADTILEAIANVSKGRREIEMSRTHG
ncbi:MAG: flavodoxin family protein [Caldilineaceae bacterium]|nr:flavodoxin family protein [Caldilineaceae bacterium]